MKLWPGKKKKEKPPKTGDQLVWKTVPIHKSTLVEAQAQADEKALPLATYLRAIITRHVKRNK